MNNGFYEYIVEYWDEIDKRVQTVYGVTYAGNFSEAVHNIEKYYDNIESIKIEELEPLSCYEFNTDSSLLKTFFNFKIEE